MSWPNLADVAVYVTIGAALGAIYLLLLFQAVRLLASQAAGMRVVLLFASRFALAAAVFWFVAQQGAAPLVLALLGFTMARFAAQRWAGAG